MPRRLPSGAEGANAPPGRGGRRTRSGSTRPS